MRSGCQKGAAQACGKEEGAREVRGCGLERPGRGAERRRDGQHRARGLGAAGRGDQQGSVLGDQGAGLQTSEGSTVRRATRCVHWVGGAWLQGP